MLALNMSCVDVMYQSYASYFPYQRPSAASPVTDPFKKFGSLKHDPGLDAASSYSSHSASSLSSLPAATSGSHAHVHHTGNSSSHLHGTHTPSSPPALSAPSTVVTKIEESHPHGPSPDLLQQQQQQQQRHHSQQQHHQGDTHKDGGGGGAGNASAPTPHNAQYLSTNCVLFTYYAGDVAAHVDEHFTRALSHTGSTGGSPTSPSSSASYPPSADGPGAATPKSPSWKGSSPMSHRNFPASFWNSSYHQAASASLSHHDPLGSLHSTSGDAYMTSPLHSMSSLGGDPWRYSLTSQTHSAPYASHASHHNVHDMAYAASISSTGRFQPHYGSLLGSSRLGAVGGQCELSKHSMDGHWGSRYHAESLGAPNLASHHDTAAHHLHSAITAGGIESAVQEPSKDLYWF